MKDLVEYLAKALVERPEQVAVTETTADSGSVRLELQVAPEDRGRVIGKSGRTAHAIRTLLSAASKNGTPVTLDIVD